MIIATERMTNVIVGMGEYVGKWDNGYPVILDGYGNQNAYVASDVELHEPSYVQDYIEPSKYCYTPEKGFYENPNYTEPVHEEDLSEQEVIDSIMQEVSGYEY